MQEVIQNSKANNKTAFITWIDLVDAFGSLPHMLIPYVLRHYYIPSKIVSYISSIYSKLKGRVKSRDWETDEFDFLCGAFQGDPFSGILFLISFNPIVEYIKQFKHTQGYMIEKPQSEVNPEDETETDKETTATAVITTPFADDFNVISRNKEQHQILLLDIQEKAKSMGFLFKSRKCRTLSICNGKSSNVTFVIKDFENSNLKVHIETMHERSHKFLGSQITHTNTSRE